MSNLFNVNISTYYLQLFAPIFFCNSRTLTIAITVVSVKWDEVWFGDHQTTPMENTTAEPKIGHKG